MSSWTQFISPYAAGTEPLQTLFQQDSKRATSWGFALEGLYVDLAKQQIDAPMLAACEKYLERIQLGRAIQDLLGGEIVNHSEQRAAWHSILRLQALADSPAQFAEVHSTRERMLELVEEIRAGGKSLGFDGITDVVNIGIGGSDLGPRLATRALGQFQQNSPRVHFVANVDGQAMAAVLPTLPANSTIFLIVSKSFGTQETRMNAELARHWLAENNISEDQIDRRFFAITTNTSAAAKFGVPFAHILPMWDFVGGRFSVWGPVGFVLAIAIGAQHFREFLRGAASMDQHFAATPFAKNLPVLLGLVGCLNRNAFAYASHAIVAYDERLSLLPNYLQQLEMESNGKAFQQDGNPADQTAPVLWGGVGTDVQHAFFQAIHQGTQVVPVDFIGVIKPAHSHVQNHDALLANMLAQSAALLRGKSAAEIAVDLGHQETGVESNRILAAQKTFPGNRPSTTILLDSLTPYALGQLLALYEHKVFAQSRIWNINAFDQWGVELGKLIAADLLPAFRDDRIPKDTDSSTNALLNRIRAAR
jgi:glucose-6-phosphate isomerase